MTDNVPRLTLESFYAFLDVIIRMFTGGKEVEAVRPAHFDDAEWEAFKKFKDFHALVGKDIELFLAIHKDCKKIITASPPANPAAELRYWDSMDAKVQGFKEDYKKGNDLLENYTKAQRVDESARVWAEFTEMMFGDNGLVERVTEYRETLAATLHGVESNRLYNSIEKKLGAVRNWDDSQAKDVVNNWKKIFNKHGVPFFKNDEASLTF